MNDNSSNGRYQTNGDRSRSPQNPHARQAYGNLMMRSTPFRKVATSGSQGGDSAFRQAPNGGLRASSRKTKREEERRIVDARAKRRQAAVADAGLVGANQRQSSDSANKSKKKVKGPLTPTQKMLRRKKIMRIGSLGLVVVIAVLSVLVAVVYKLTLARLNTLTDKDFTIPKEISDKIQEENLVNAVPYDEMITNILLLGIDSRDENIKERSDSMIVLSINRRDSAIKMISLQRDMWVPIPGAGYGKINSANAIGGPALAMKTVNRLLRLDIRKFAVVNMYNMRKLIDLLDGVYINVPNEEVLRETNRILKAQDSEMYTWKPSSPLENIGRQLATGDQALAFARQRNTGAGDYDRMKRQREVIAAMFSRFKESSIPTMIKMVGEGASMITTNLTQAESLGIATTAVPAISQVKQMQIPIVEYAREYLGGSSMGWVILCDFNGMIPSVQEFLYGKQFPFDRVPVIDGAPNSGSEVRDASPRSSTDESVITEPKLEPTSAEKSTNETTKASSVTTMSTGAATNPPTSPPTTLPKTTSKPKPTPTPAPVTPTPAP